MNRVLMNIAYISKIVTTITGTIYAILGFIGMFVPFNEILPVSLSIWIKIAISITVLIILWLFTFIIVTVILVKKKRFAIISANNGHKLYLQYGDLFDINIVLNTSERRNIVIPVNRCFDTIVDNTLISENTLQGMTFMKLYSKNLYNQNTLDEKIQQLLENKDYEIIEQTDKSKGNLKRFPVGTVIDLPGEDNIHYLLLALSTFDKTLKAQTNMNDYTIAIQKLVEACNTESGGFPVVLPIIGTGLSRTKKDQNDIVSYLINAFRINRTEINSDIHIVIKEDIKNQISIMNMK